MTPKERAVVSIQNESETISSLSMMRTAMQQALKAMEDASPYGLTFKEAITATREALAVSEQRTEEQADQEPVGYIDAADLRELCNGNERQYSLSSEDKGRMVAIYAAPVRTKDLTDDDIDDVRDKTWCLNNSLRQFARAVIAADRSKNGII